MMNLMSQLVLKRNELNVHSSRINEPNLSKTIQEVSSVMTELQEKVMKTRLQPVSTVFNPLPGVVRELSRNLGKEVELTLEGRDTELDRSILEGVKDPLTHILRNSLDHGFEMPEEREAAGKSPTCQLLIRAFHEGGQVVIEIRDDGRGVNIDVVSRKAIEKGVFTPAQVEAMTDTQKAEIIFHPGLSTTDKVSQVSGRGVGMDVVKSNIINMGGQVELDSHWGRGTSLMLKIPLTLAIVPALIVGGGGHLYTLSQANLEEMVLLGHDELDQIETVQGIEVYRLRGQVLPVVRLNRILGIDRVDDANGANIVVLKAGQKRFGLLVEKLHDIEEIVVKNLDDLLASHRFFSGATILGDGSIALIMDVLRLSQLMGMSPSNTDDGSLPNRESTLAENGQVLLFSTDGQNIYGIPMESVERLEHIDRDIVDRINDKWFLRYRGAVLPLISSWKVLGKSDPNPLPEEIHVVVFRMNNQESGIVVDHILDVVPLEGALVKDLNVEPHLLGSSILQKRVVSILNLAVIVEEALQSSNPKAKERVLMWESSPEMADRAMDLRDKGFEVTEVHSREEMEEALKSIDVDVILTENSMDEDERQRVDQQLEEKYGNDDKVSVLSLDNEDDLWESDLESDELADVIEDILQSKLND